MTDPEDLTVGEKRVAEIASRIGHLQSTYYGNGLIQSKGYITDDVVLVALYETFAKAEKTLVELGEQETIKQIRRRFKQHMADESTGIVEQVTGRVVRTFMSETDLESDVSVEFFLFGEDPGSRPC